MKYIIYLLFIVTSCTTQKRSIPDKQGLNLSGLEKEVINDFLNDELKKADYHSYHNFQYVVIKEAFPKKLFPKRNLYQFTSLI